jgi:2-C-methyl-D-erythritol 4-phosphate cytidylyltransferase
VSPLAPRAVIVSEAARPMIAPADITPPEPALI